MQLRIVVILWLVARDIKQTCSRKVCKRTGVPPGTSGSACLDGKVNTCSVACIYLQDWDILYLNALWPKLGKAVSPHLVAVRWTPTTTGYIATPAFAAKVLENACSSRYATWVDLMYEVRA